MTLTETLWTLPRYVRVTGSYARGEETDDSDIDFYVPEGKWEHFKKWAITHLGDGYTSCAPMSLTWREPFMLEFSVLFRRQKGVVKERNLNGRTFKTW